MGEVVRAGQILKFHAGEAVRDGGEHHGSVRPGIDVTITREPVGVVGIVTPWNFPIAIPAWKIAPALANGNTVVFKPAELVPASAWALVDILHRAGLPPGVLNLVMGRGSEIGDALVGARDVDAVASPARSRPVPTSCRWRRRIAPVSNSRWVARTRSSSLTMPTWRSRWTAPRRVPSSRPASAARPRRA